MGVREVVPITTLDHKAMLAPRLLDIYEPVRKTQRPGVLLSTLKFLGFL